VRTASTASAPARRPRTRGRFAALAFALAFALSGCADTVQDRPIPHNNLETLLGAPFPVFWVGRAFHGMAITETAHDPGGAFTVQYGDCRQGGQGTCRAPLRVITSPDNSFVPGYGAAQRTVTIRGVAASVMSGGRSIVFATAGVIVGIYTLDAGLAAAAAQAAVAISEAGSPGDPLAPALPDTGYAETPLPSQLPAPLARPGSSSATGGRRSSCVSTRTCGPRRR
jgi:hypothetical protein